MKGLSQVTSKIDGQPMFKYLDKAKALEAQGRHLIHMEIGEPDFDTPMNVTWAAVKSLAAGETHYGSSFGMIEFREAVQFATERSRGFKPDIDQILIAPGAKCLTQDLAHTTVISKCAAQFRLEFLSRKKINSE